MDGGQVGRNSKIRVGCVDIKKKKIRITVNNGVLSFFSPHHAFKIHNSIRFDRTLLLLPSYFISLINHPPAQPFPFSLHLRGRESFPELRDISSVSR